VGRDVVIVLLFMAFLKFQSTRPRGARHDHKTIAKLRQAVSIHAPAWGATKETVTSALNVACFNPRARVGRDH